MKSFFVKNYFFKIKLSLFNLIVLGLCFGLITLQLVSVIFTPKDNIVRAAGNSYYVDGASIGGICNNNNTGTISQPWCTIAKATGSGSPVVAGDTIYLRAGTYTGTVDFYKSGANGNPITLTAYQNETVNIAGELRIDPNAISGYLAENWTISKLNITNPSRDGIHITNGNHTGTITIDNCHISNNKANGIVTGWGNQNIGTIIIKNNTIQYNDNGHEDGNSGLMIYAYGTYIIQNNNISYNGDPNRTSSGNKGINFYSGANRCVNCLIENNTILNNLETGMDFHGTNSIIRNNLIIGNGQQDTEAGEYGDNGLSMQGYAINNKVYNNIIASSGGVELSVSGSGNEYYNNTFYKDYNYTAVPVPTNQYYSTIILWNTSGNVFRNNVIVNTLNINNRQFLLETYEFNPSLYTSQTWSNNLYYSSYGAQGNAYIKINNLTNLTQLQATGQDQNSLFADPQFINGISHDFRLPATSPGVDHGYNLAGIVSIDYAGVVRPQGLAYDLGAYEYVSGVLPQVPADPILQSSTHPDETAWYNAAPVSLSLASGSGANHYHYLVDQNPTSSLSALANGTQDSDGIFTVNLASDGTWHIHIVAHDTNHNPSNNFDNYTINHDQTPPVGAVINFTNVTSISITANVSGASDPTSGLNLTEPYYFENLTNNANSSWQTGTAWVNNNLNSSTSYNYKIKIRDKAGNILEVTSSQSTQSGGTNSNSNSNSNTNTNTNSNTNQGGGGGGGGGNNNSNSNTNSNPGPEPTNQEGLLVKASNSSTVYYLSEANHDRYTFPDEKVFYSWYYNFDSVETISSSELLSYSLVGNVTMRPGTHLVKIQADPKVYVVEPGGVLRWIASETVFYGLGYNFFMVVDVPEIFFQNYTVGDPIININAHPQGVLIKYPFGSAVYYWDGTNKRALANEGAFWQNRFYWEYVLTIPESIQYSTGNIISSQETNLILSW